MREPYAMRAPCPACSCGTGYVTERGAQDVVRCIECNRHCYNAPRVETGKAVRSVTTVRNSIKPKRRARIIMRAGGRCELCHATNKPLHAGHIIGVDIGLRYGLTEVELNDDENLTALCDECNLGMGAEPIPLTLAVAIVRARMAWVREQQSA